MALEQVWDSAGPADTGINININIESGEIIRTSCWLPFPLSCSQFFTFPEFCSPYWYNFYSSYIPDICNLIACVKEITKQTRSARTIVWCALQMLYANIQAGSSGGEWTLRCDQNTRGSTRRGTQTNERIHKWHTNMCTYTDITTHKPTERSVC